MYFFSQIQGIPLLPCMVLIPGNNHGGGALLILTLLCGVCSAVLALVSFLARTQLLLRINISIY